jgi:hypothetical protein
MNSGVRPNDWDAHRITCPRLQVRSEGKSPGAINGKPASMRQMVKSFAGSLARLEPLGQA